MKNKPDKMPTLKPITYLWKTHLIVFHEKEKKT